MVKEIIWSEQSKQDLKHILAYWALRNKSKLYSVKLNRLLKDGISLIAIYPFIGKLTDVRNVRAKKVRDYFIFYSEKGNQIHILTIWDTRQNPLDIKERLE